MCFSFNASALFSTIAFFCLVSLHHIDPLLFCPLNNFAFFADSFVLFCCYPVLCYLYWPFPTYHWYLHFITIGYSCSNYTLRHHHQSLKPAGARCVSQHKCWHAIYLTIQCPSHYEAPHGFSGCRADYITCIYMPVVRFFSYIVF
jgi:hypothetical protein